jgi:hypothetical protein
MLYYIMSKKNNTIGLLNANKYFEKLARKVQTDNGTAGGKDNIMIWVMSLH